MSTPKRYLPLIGTAFSLLILLAPRAAMADTILAGTVTSVTSVPNVPGARCGNHIEVVVTRADKSTQTVEIRGRSVARDQIAALIGRPVEMTVTDANTVAKLTTPPVAGRTDSALAFSTVKGCG